MRETGAWVGVSPLFEDNCDKFEARDSIEKKTEAGARSKSVGAPAKTDVQEPSKEIQETEMKKDRP